MTERQRSYYVCDGCGYEIDRDSQHGMLTLVFKPHRKVAAEAKHFHAPRLSSLGPGSEPPPLMQDCLDYWWHNRKARELAEGKTW